MFADTLLLARRTVDEENPRMVIQQVLVKFLDSGQVVRKGLQALNKQLAKVYWTLTREVHPVERRNLA